MIPNILALYYLPHPRSFDHYTYRMDQTRSVIIAKLIDVPIKRP